MLPNPPCMAHRSKDGRRCDRTAKYRCRRCDRPLCGWHRSSYCVGYLTGLFHDSIPLPIPREESID